MWLSINIDIRLEKLNITLTIEYVAKKSFKKYSYRNLSSVVLLANF